MYLFESPANNIAESNFTTPATAESTIATPATMALIVLALLALYCLWMSQVRTALLGLVVYAGV